MTCTQDWKFRLSKFTDNKKLGGAADKLESWTITKCVKFNKHSAPRCMYRLGNDFLESSVMERDLGVLVDSKLNMNH